MPLIYTPIDDFGPGGAGVNGAWQIAQGSSEIGELIIPGSYLGKPVRRIAELAFFGSTTITKLIIPSSITRIYSGAFHNCANLTEIIIAPDGGMLIIDPRAFKNCSALKKIFFPDRVSFSSFSIGDGEHFAGCTSLVSVRLMTTPSLGLPPALFNGCISLKSIIIPAGVDYLGDSTFRNCTNLSAIYFLGNCPLISASSLVNTHPNLKLYRKKNFVTGWPSSVEGVPVVLWSDNVIKSGGTGKLITKERTPRYEILFIDSEIYIDPSLIVTYKNNTKIPININYNYFASITNGPLTDIQIAFSTDLTNWATMCFNPGEVGTMKNALYGGTLLPLTVDGLTYTARISPTSYNEAILLPIPRGQIPNVTTSRCYVKLARNTLWPSYASNLNQLVDVSPIYAIDFPPGSYLDTRFSPPAIYQYTNNPPPIFIGIVQ